MADPKTTRDMHFVHPLFDYFLIGGGLSLVFLVLLFAVPGLKQMLSAEAFMATTIPFFILLSNNTHFAASTVRLYSKPGSYKALPFLTFLFPLIMVLLLTASIAQADRIGPFIQAVYLSWSPFHYAAQAYGLGVLYCYRSGCAISIGHKRILWWAALMPFVHNMLAGESGTGISIVLPLHWLAEGTTLATVIDGLQYLAIGLSAGLLLWFCVAVRKDKKRFAPLITPLAIITNGIWWLLLPPLDAFIWATIFHGIQYLAIVVIFHVKDQLQLPGNRHSRAYHVAWFYLVSLGVAYGLFSCLPSFYMLAGFGEVESILLVVAAINLHHFIVDAYIWRFGDKDRNRRIAQETAPAPAV